MKRSFVKFGMFMLCWGTMMVFTSGTDGDDTSTTQPPTGREDGGSGGGYSCSVTSTYYSYGQPSGSISCTGIQKCERSSGGLFSNPWVKCDGKKTSC